MTVKNFNLDGNKSLKLNIQHFAGEANLTDTEALGQAKSIEFASRFGFQLDKFMEALGITRKLPMGVGTALHKYAMKVEEDAGGGVVAEGDIIPLTKVTREKIDIIELDFQKHRKSTPMEAIQAHGYDLAIQQTDDELFKFVQGKIRDNFFDDVFASATHEKRTNTDPLTSTTLQGAVALAQANLSDYADQDVSTIVIANPYDVAEHLGDGQINSTGAVFGVNLLEGYTNVKIMTNRRVERGTIFSTVAENLVVPYVNMKGEVNKAFPISTDETGFIGVLHDIQSNRLTSDTVTAFGVKLFADNVDLVNKVTIEEAGTSDSEPVA